MNRLHLRIQWDRESNIEIVRVFIDGADLVDLVRPVELPFATAERNADIAGRYEGLLARDWLELPERRWPSRAAGVCWMRRTGVLAAQGPR